MNHSTLFGIKVFESTMAVTVVQNRTHKKRRSQSAAYHRRISKKWAKRYGSTQKPGMYTMLSPMGERVWVMHPEIYARLRAEVGQQMFGFDESPPLRPLAPQRLYNYTFGPTNPWRIQCMF